MQFFDSGYKKTFVFEAFSIMINLEQFSFTQVKDKSFQQEEANGALQNVDEPFSRLQSLKLANVHINAERICLFQKLSSLIALDLLDCETDASILNQLKEKKPDLKIEL